MIVKLKQRKYIRRKPISYAEKKELIASGRDIEIVFKGKRLVLEKYSENDSYAYKKGTYEADSFFGVKGLYFLLDDKLNVVYIGESTDCIKRISQHYDNENKNFKFFKIYKFNGTTTHRKTIEKNLIKRYNPILNIQHNCTNVL